MPVNIKKTWLYPFAGFSAVSNYYYYLKYYSMCLFFVNGNNVAAGKKKGPVLRTGP